MAARSAGWRRQLLAALYPLTLATLLVSLAGWESCYVFVQDRSSEQVAALFGGQLVGPLLSAREADTPKAAWPSVGPAGRRWTMVIDPHLEFGDSDDVFAPGSVGTRIVRLAVIEREWFSHTKLWVDGTAAWEVSFEGELDDRPMSEPALRVRPAAVQQPGLEPAERHRAVARCWDRSGGTRRERAMQGPATSTNRRATAVALALVVMATLAGCTGTQQPATRAGGAQAAGPASQDPQGRPHATPATPEPEPLLPPQPPPDAVNLPSGRLAPVYYKVPTTQPVVFLTIDDGWTPSLPVLELLRARHLPVAVFLVDRAWRRDPAYFRALQAAGATVEDHTLTHPVLSRLPLARQEREVCGGAAGEAAGFGTRPTLLRPPFGAFDRATLLAAHAHLTVGRLSSYLVPRT